MCFPASVYLFYLPFDPKPVAIAVTFVTQPFQFNFTTTALSQLTIFGRALPAPLSFVSSPSSFLHTENQKGNGLYLFLIDASNSFSNAYLYHRVAAAALNRADI